MKTFFPLSKWLPSLVLLFCGVQNIRADLVQATFNSAADIPVTAASYVAAGNSIQIGLNFAPPAGTDLLVIKNNGLPFIEGNFDNLNQGQPVDLTYSGVTYHFIANYYGGSGNDLVLRWANTRLVGWGSNIFGQLGINNNVNSPLLQTAVNSGVLAGKTVLSTSTGSSFSLALCSDGTIAASGYNAEGQLGNGNLQNSSVPVAVTLSGVLAGKTVVAVSSGTAHSLALCSDGTVAAWGSNLNGCLGNNSTTSSQLPVAVDISGALAGKKVVAISAGHYFSLALCSDGTVAAWGANGANQLILNGSPYYQTPVSMSSAGALAGKMVISISSGVYHSLALCADGTLIAWGFGAYVGNNNSSSVFAPVAINGFGVLAGKTVVSMAAGGSHSLALCSDGTVAAWGSNSSGQLGDNSTAARYIPVNITGSGVLAGKTVVELTAGNSYSLAVCSDGSRVAWGYNSSGQLGNNGTSSSSVPVLVDLSGLADSDRLIASRASAPGYSSLGLVASPQDGPKPVITSGSSEAGTFGIPFANYTVTANNSPLSYSAQGLPPGLSVNSTSGLLSGTPLAAGSYSGTVNATNGGGTAAAPFSFTVAKALASIDLNNLSASYDGSPKAVTATTNPAGLNTVITYDGSSEAPGTIGSYAVQATINNSNYQGSTSGVLVISGPAPSINANFISATTVPITANGYFTSGASINFILSHNPVIGGNLTVVNNTSIQFIQGTFSNLAQGQPVTLTRNGVNYYYVANYYGGSGNDLVLQWAHVRPLAWGQNNTGQVGDGSSTTRLGPVTVSKTGVLANKVLTSVSAGTLHSLALCSDGTVAAWGYNGQGQLGNNSNTLSNVPVGVTRTGVLSGKTVVAIAAGGTHSLALCSDGTVAAWGDNSYGQLGRSGSSSTVPVAVTVTGSFLQGKKVVAIAAGYRHSLALCSDGRVASWGNNEYGQLASSVNNFSSVPISAGFGQLNAIVAIAAGSNHNLALDGNGIVSAWGQNSSGQLGNNGTNYTPFPVVINGFGVLTTNRPVSIAAGENHSLALCDTGYIASWGSNTYGQLGNNTTTSSSVPLYVTRSGYLAARTVTSVAAGSIHSMALCSDGSIATWGNSDLGQLGGGNPVSRPVPGPTNAPEACIAMSTGSSSNHALGLAVSRLPLITSPTSATGRAGVAFTSYTATAISYSSPTGITYSAQGLPSGLNIHPGLGEISGTTSLEGTFTVTLQATNSMGTGTAILTLTITPPTLTMFRSANTLASDASEDLLMPAGDQVPNILKYAFNMIGNGPGQKASLNIPNRQTVGETGTAGLPAIAVDGAGRLTITYIQRKASSGPGIIYMPEFTNDLVNDFWNPYSFMTTAITSIDADFERVTVTDYFSGGRRFGRVRIVVP